MRQEVKKCMSACRGHEAPEQVGVGGVCVCGGGGGGEGVGRGDGVVRGGGNGVRCYAIRTITVFGGFFFFVCLFSQRI